MRRVQYTISGTTNDSRHSRSVRRELSWPLLRLELTRFCGYLILLGLVVLAAITLVPTIRLWLSSQVYQGIGNCEVKTEGGGYLPFD